MVLNGFDIAAVSIDIAQFWIVQVQDIFGGIVQIQELHTFELYKLELYTAQFFWIVQKK